MKDKEAIQIPFKLSSKKEMRIFKTKEAVVARDILRIGHAIFNLEKQLKEGRHIEELKIPLSLGSYTEADYNNLGTKLTKLVNAVVGKEVKIKITSNNEQKKRPRKLSQERKAENLCLFSGGVDSFVGYHLAKKKYPDLLPVFVAHSDQASVISIVNRISKKYDIAIRTVHAPKIRGKKKGYSQLRGFLYVLCIGALAEIIGAKRIIITECGATMYQPKFGPYDSVTHTTHPLVLHTAKTVIETLLKRKIILSIPFEDLTKSDIMALHDAPAEIKDTHSCIRGQFKDQCGTCYGCVLRRLAEILLNNDNTKYEKDILTDASVDIDNLLSLLYFSYNLLFDSDQLQPYSTEKIEVYSKEDLFTRQSWDVMAALDVAKRNNLKFSVDVQRAITEYVDNVNKERLQERILNLKTKEKQPNFDKEVI